MAWKDDLLPASYRGAAFEVLRTRDHGEHAVAEHEYPYRDGGEVEDQGRKVRRVSITAVFWGPKYKQALQSLVAELEKRGKGELVHPVFGPVQVQPVSWDIPHEAERPDYAEVALEFTEAGVDNPFFGAKPGRLAATGAAAGTATDKAASAKARTGAALAEAIRKAAKALSPAGRIPARNLLAEGLDAYGQVSGAVRSGLSYLDFPTAYLSDLEAVQNLAAAPFGLFSGSLSGWLGLARLFAPASPGGSLSGGGSLSYQGTTSPADVAVLTELSDVATVHDNTSRAATVTEAATSLLEAEAYTSTLAPTLTPAQVETVVGQTREQLQGSIDEARAKLPPAQAHQQAEDLRDAALAVQELGAAVIARQPPLVRHTVQAPCNLHLLAHRLYSDYSRAGEIARLNPGLRDPNFLTPGQELDIHGR